MNLRLFVGCAIVFALAASLRAGTFLWTADETAFHAFHDPANWTQEGDAGSRTVPGPDDRLADRKTMRLDLGGKDVRVKDWHALADWKRRDLFIRNGSLRFDGWVNVHGGTIEVEKDAALVFGEKSNFIPGNNDAGKRRLRMRPGGRFTLIPGARLDSYNFGLTVEPGGVADILTTDVRITHGNQHSYIENAGTLNLPNGLALQKGSRGASLTLRQQDGRLTVAGAVSTNGFPAKVFVELSGGTVSATSNAVFDVSKLTLKKDAALEVETCADAVLDWSLLTAEPNARLVKRGKGILALGRILPENLTIAEGGLGLYASGKVEGLRRANLADGTEIRLGAENIAFTEAPSARCIYSVDLARIAPGAILFTCADAALRKKIKGDIRSRLPHDLGLADEGDAVRLKLNFVASKPGVHDWHAARTWGNGKVPKRAHALIAGKGVTVRVTQPVGAGKSIVVTDGATMRVETSAALPKIILRGDATLSVGVKGRKASVRALNGLVLESDGETKPKILLAEEASLVVREGEVDFGAAEARLKGKVKWLAKKPLKTWTDAVNRCFYVSAEDIDRNAARYRYAHPDFSDLKETDFKTLGVKRMRRVPVYHSRLKKNDATPFPVSVEVTQTNGTILVQTGIVTPRPEPIKQPFDNDKILVGQTLYGTNWYFRDLMVTNELCNLLVVWGDARRLFESTMSPEVLAKSKKDKFHYMTIYGYGSRETIDRLKKEHGPRYIFDNIGEYAGYLYTWAKGKNDQPYRDVIELKNRFVEDWMQKAWRRSHKTQDFMFSTSGAAVANYELEGGVEYICNELYAVGAHNLAYASSEARGAARRWGPEFWCSWLASEWQTFGVPYHTVQKYALTLAGFLQQYVMGTSLMVLESGAQNTQAHPYTAKQNKVKEEFHDYAPTRYRETTKEFYDFVRRHPRAKGTPETNIGFIIGNGDAYLGLDDPHYAVWAAQSDAGTNTNWRYGAPEHLWRKIQHRFFPICPGALAPCPNNWLAGTPYGQCDIVCVDDLARYSDVARYKLMSFIGWNTATPEAMAVMDHYVQKGGRLVMALPHASTRVDREHTNWTREDLIAPYRGWVKAKGTMKGAVVLAPELVAQYPGLAKELKDFSIGTELPVAELSLQALRDWKVLIRVGDAPLLLARREGKGTRYLFLSWEYPGNDPLAKIFTATLAALAEATEQTLALEPRSVETANDRNFLCAAVYGDTAYVLNMDCTKPHVVNLRTAKRVIPLDLAPCSMYRLDLRTGAVEKIFDGPSSKTFNPPKET